MDVRIRSLKKKLDMIPVELARLKDEIAKLQAARAEKAAPVAKDLLSIYNRLLTKADTVPFVPVTQGSCGNCHLKMTPQTVNRARKGELAFCDNCGYLVYFKE